MNVANLQSIVKPRQDEPLIATSLQNLDAFLNLLRATADSAALAEAEGEIVEALYFLHKSLKAECDQLARLL